MSFFGRMRHRVARHVLRMVGLATLQVSLLFAECYLSLFESILFVIETLWAVHPGSLMSVPLLLPVRIHSCWLNGVQLRSICFLFSMDIQHMDTRLMCEDMRA